MKYNRFLLLTLLFSTPLLGFSQSSPSCDEVKKENASLKAALAINEPILTQNLDKTEIRLVKAFGNIKSQTIRFEVLLTNHAANKEVTLMDVKGVDLEGTEYNTGSDNIRIGTGSYWAKITTEVPVKASAELTKVLPDVKFLKLIRFDYKSDDQSSRLPVEFRDVKIDWK
ncbi:MAG TPA: hypothetical protein VF691_05585 [Cytophagaceae bacterium]|jgi:hypothetical protein